MSDYKLATNALHAGHDVNQTSGTRAVPIYQTSSYVVGSPKFEAVSLINKFTEYDTKKIHL